MKINGEAKHQKQNLRRYAQIIFQAPFSVVLIPINMHKSERLRNAAEKLYHELQSAGIDVLFDDRNERAGVMFADMDLIGIPHRLVLSERGLDADVIEYKHRREKEARNISFEEVFSLLEIK